MPSYSRYLTLAFAVGGLLLWLLLQKLIALIMVSTKLTDTLLFEVAKLSQVLALVLAVGITVYVWFRADVQTWSNEVAAELSKVTWPTWSETKQHTLVVIVFSLVMAGILTVFDLFWKWLTDMILL